MLGSDCQVEIEQGNQWRGWDFRGISQRYLAPLPVIHSTSPELLELHPVNCPRCPLLEEVGQNSQRQRKAILKGNNPQHL